MARNERALAVLAILGLSACWTKPGPPPSDDHLDDPVHLAAGAKHACRIDNAGTLACWGDNAHGQLGATAAAASGTPLHIDGTWSWIAAGDRHSCGIVEGAVFCWGNDLGKAQVVLPGNARAAKVFAGGNASCAIDDAGRAYCWGFASPFAEQFAQPTEIEPGHQSGPWRSITLAADHACAIDDANAKLYCWGANDVDQIDTTGALLALVDAPAAPGQFVAASVGPGATCAVTLDRGLVCGGDVSTGMVGTAPANTPQYTIDTMQRWTAVALGRDHVCGIASSGVACFGADDRGALGDGTFEPRLALPSAAVAPATNVVAGDGFSCAIDADGKVSCWGSNAYGELGNGEIASRFAPTPVTTGLDFLERASAGDGHTCVSGKHGGNEEVRCFGNNASGQVSPTESATLVTSPVAVVPPRGTGLYELSAGGHHSCAVVRDSGPDADRYLYCWGANDHGQLGVSDPAARTATLDVKAFSPFQGYWLEVDTSATTTCAIDDGFGAFCWGRLPGLGDRQPPTELSISAAHVALGDSAIIVAKYASSTEVWSYGIDPTATCSPGANLPTAVQLINNSIAPPNDFNVAAGRAHGCAVETGAGPGRLTCWGNNTHGQTGNPPSTCTAGPALVFPSTNWDPGQPARDVGETVTAAGDHSCAFDASSKLNCWGRNARGELAGLPDSTGVAGVVAPPPGVTWLQASTGTWHTCAIADSQQRLDCWGENRFGELGIGSSFHATPAPITN